MHIFVGDGNSNERKTFDISCKSGYSKGLWGFDSIFVLDLTQKSKFWHHQVLSVKLFWAPEHLAPAKITASATHYYYIWYILWIFIYLCKNMYFVTIKFTILKLFFKRKCSRQGNCTFWILSKLHSRYHFPFSNNLNLVFTISFFVWHSETILSYFG